jgi:hypothetical protein
MATQTVDYQASVYVYDLNNCAREHGFKADDEWEFSMANDEDKKFLEKKYYPVVTAKVLPEILSELFKLVKTKLVQAKVNLEHKMDTGSVPESSLQYLIAYNPKRHR